MEQILALKQVESQLSLVSDHAHVLAGKLEDLLFRAQRIASALKNKTRVSDVMFGYDLQNFRRDVRSFGTELEGMSGRIAKIEVGAVYDEASFTHAQSVMRLTDRLHKALSALHDQALLAHQHIRSAEHKVEAWYLVQEIEALVQAVKGLPSAANKVVIRVSTPPEAPPPPAA